MLKSLYGSEELLLKIGNVTLQPYILNDGSAVITKGSFQKALGYDGKSESWLYDFLGSINKFYPIPGILFEVYEKPIIFEAPTVNGQNVLEGIIPETVEMTCLTITNAKIDGYLSLAQLKHAKVAQRIFNYALESNLHDDIANATGYIFIKEATKKLLEAFILTHSYDPVYRWTKSLPDNLFEKLMEHRQLAWQSVQQNPSDMAEVLWEIVFSRLPETLLENLRDEKPKRAYKTKNSSAGHEHARLSLFCAEVLSLLKASAGNWNNFLQLRTEVHSKNSLIKPQFPNSQVIKKSTEDASALDYLLQKGVFLNRTYKKHK